MLNNNIIFSARHIYKKRKHASNCLVVSPNHALSPPGGGRAPLQVQGLLFSRSHVASCLCILNTA